MVKSGVYKITNKVDGKFYIGSSSDTDDRWVCHKRDLRSGQHINPKLQHAWNFHGEDAFVFTVVEVVKPKPQLLFERENHYLSTLKPYIREVGYNICPTAQGGDNITHNPNRDDFIRKMKVINRGKGNGMYGKKHSSQTIKDMKNKSIGRYTLEWYIERYGNRKGKKQFEKRRKMLMRRKINCTITPIPLMSFKGRKHRKNFRAHYNHTKIYFRNHWKDFVKLIKSRKYSQRQLSIMLGIPRITLRAKTRRILGQ